MNLQKSKKLIALTISIMLIVSMCMTGTSVSAATKSDNSVAYADVYSDVYANGEVATTVPTEPATTAPTEPAPAMVSEPSENAVSNEPAEQINIEPAEEETMRIFCYSEQYINDEWINWEEVYAYYWDETEGDMVQWPGKKMTCYDEDREYFYYGYEAIAVIPANAKRVTFHNNDGQQIANVAIEGGDKIYKYGNWEEASRYINFDNRATKWDTIYAYYWSETDNSMVQWPGIELKGYEEYYSNDWLRFAEIPFDATNIFFHNNEGSQTSASRLPEGFNPTFSSFENSWSSNLDDVQMATAEADICIVAGDEELCGTDWDGDLSTSYHNAMDKTSEDDYYNYDSIYDEDGNYLGYRYIDDYEKVYKDVEPANGLQLKIANHYLDAGHSSNLSDLKETETWYGNENGHKVTFNVTEKCDVKVTFNLATQKITVTGDGVEIVPDFEIESMYVYGNGSGIWLNDKDMDVDAAKNKMTLVDKDKYQIKFKGMGAVSGSKFKFAANGSDEYTWGGTYEGSEVESDAVFGSSDFIAFDTAYAETDVIITIDFSDYNPSLHTGAKFSVYVDDKTTATLNFVIPKATKNVKAWDKGVYLAYSNDYNPSSFTKLALTKTEHYRTPELYTDSLVKGSYSVYSIDLNQEQIDAINNSAYVAVMNSSNDYRTYASIKYSLLKAPVGKTASDVYGTTRADIADLDRHTFIMNDEIETGSSIQGYATFTGFWESPYADVDESVTIKVVVPAAARSPKCWNNGVYLAYSDSYELNSFTKIKMEKAMYTQWVYPNTEYLTYGEYNVYTVTLTGDQVGAINNSGYVVIMNASGDYRTYINKKYNIFNASLYDSEYSATKKLISEYDNCLFEVNDCINTGTSIEGYGTFTGCWREYY